MTVYTVILNERVLHLMHVYADETDDTKHSIIDSLVTMYINEWSSVTMYPNNFDNDYVQPWEVVEAMEDINAEMGFRYKYTLRTNDEHEWMFRVSMTEEERKCLFE